MSVETITGPAGELVRWGQAASAAHALATSLCRTKFVPEAFQGEDRVGDATAAILLGAELGLSPVASLRAVFVAKSGQPTMYARTMVALVLSRGHEVWTESEGEGRVTVAGRRAGSEHVERVTWTLDRARAAGLAGRNPVYRDHPQAMLYARAASDVARRLAPDVLLGIPEGLADEAGTGEPVEAVVTVQRRTTPTATAPSIVPSADVRQPPVPEQAPPEQASEQPPPDEPEAEQGEPPEPPITGPQRAKLHAEFNALGLQRPAYLQWVRTRLDKPDLQTTNDLTVTEAGYLLDLIEQGKRDRQGGRDRQLPPED